MSKSKGLDVFTLPHPGCKEGMKIGTATKRMDGSVGVTLHALPINGHLDIRERESVTRSEGAATWAQSPEDLVCPLCGCDKIHGTAWVVVNTGEPLLNDDPPRDAFWCPKCEEEHRRPDTREEYEAREKG